MTATYSTRSLWCSAYLVLKGHKLVEFQLHSPQHGYFVFKNGECTEKDVADFYNRDPEVPVRKYLEAYSRLRTMLMKARRGAGGEG